MNFKLDLALMSFVNGLGNFVSNHNALDVLGIIFLLVTEVIYNTFFSKKKKIACRILPFYCFIP